MLKGLECENKLQGYRLVGGGCGQRDMIYSFALGFFTESQRDHAFRCGGCVCACMHLHVCDLTIMNCGREGTQTTCKNKPLRSPLTPEGKKIFLKITRKFHLPKPAPNASQVSGKALTGFKGLWIRPLQSLTPEFSLLCLLPSFSMLKTCQQQKSHVPNKTVSK